MILTLLAVGIIRWHRAKQAVPVVKDEETVESVKVDEESQKWPGHGPEQSKADESTKDIRRQGGHGGLQVRDLDGEDHGRGEEKM